jgi:hypothetical protein
METSTPNAFAVELLKNFADIEQRLCDVSTSLVAERFALRELVPGFEAHYLKYLADPRISAIKHEIEQRIQSLLASARKIENS